MLLLLCIYIVAQEAINDDGMCNYPEGGGNVTVTWSVPELCGWENVVPTVSLICLTCADTQPTAPNLPLLELRSSQQISFVVELTADNYTIEINATNACGNTTVRSCEGKQISHTFWYICNALILPSQPCVPWPAT